MATLLYYWDFTAPSTITTSSSVIASEVAVANNEEAEVVDASGSSTVSLSSPTEAVAAVAAPSVVDEVDIILQNEIIDSISGLVAKVTKRGSVTNSTVSRDENGIFLDNNDGENGGYYIDLEGLNTINFGGDLTIEMVVQNHGRDAKAIYFLSVGEENNTNQAFINARYNGKQNPARMFFGVRTDEKNNSSGVTYTERKVWEKNNTAITDNSEHHYIFSFNHFNPPKTNARGDSIRLYIDGNLKSEQASNHFDLQKELTTNARSTNFIGTRKETGSGVTYLKGVVKYLKIYQNADTEGQPREIRDSEAIGLYRTYNFWKSQSNPTTDSDKISMRHDNVNLLFSDNSLTNKSSFSLLGSKLGLSYSTKSYKIWKFIENSQINIDNNFNYIPLQGENKFIIIIYASIYYKITQTSSQDGVNAKYRVDISLDYGINYTQHASGKGFDETFTHNNLTFKFGGVELVVDDSNPICFHEDTLIKTDQGSVKIKDLTNQNTIENNKIVYLVKSKSKPNKLVLIKKDAFGKNTPDKDVKITPNHEILFYVNSFLGKKLCRLPIYKFVNNKTVKIICNDNSDVYNLILLEKECINVSNLNLGVIYISSKFYSCLKNNCLSNKAIKDLEIAIHPVTKFFKKKNKCLIHKDKFNYFNNY